MRRFIFILLLLSAAAVTCSKEAVDGQDEEEPAAKGQSTLRRRQRVHSYKYDESMSGSFPFELREDISMLWSFELPAGTSSSAVIYEENIYVSCEDSNVHVISSSDGAPLKKIGADDKLNFSPLIVDGKLIFSDSRDSVYAYSLKEGRRLWKFSTLSKEAPSGPPNAAVSSRSVDILFGTHGNKLYSISLKDASINWTYETESYINGAAAFSAGKCAFGSCDNYIYVLSAFTGRELFKLDSSTYIPSSVAFERNSILAMGYSCVLMKVNAVAKEFDWRNRLGSEDGQSFASPSTDASMTLCGSRDSKLYAVDNDSSETLWTFLCGDWIENAAALSKSKVLVCDISGGVYILDKRSGELLWSYELGAEPASAPCIGEGFFTITTKDGLVYAFGGGEA